MKKTKNTKQLLFENMAKLNPDFKLTEGFGNFHDSFAERTGQMFKDANDAWTNGAFHIRYKMLVKLGIPDNLAEQYAMKYENNTWDEVKTALGKTGMNEDDKWIQKAVNPEHKGYCTPMSKPTCTPQRKALAKRFKKGIENEAYGVPDPLGTNKAKPVNNEGLGVDAYGENSVEFKEMAEKIKKAIDDLYTNGDYDILSTLYGLMIERKAKFSKKNAVAITEWINRK